MERRFFLSLILVGSLVCGAVAAEPVASDLRETTLGQDIVACCLPDGTCRDLATLPCLTLGGNPGEPGTNCKIIDCGLSAVACCFPDGECANLQKQACLNVLGRPQRPGSSCATATCEPVNGACCFPDGRCANLPPVSCFNVGGR